jgi:hypothetical protein
MTSDPVGTKSKWSKSGQAYVSSLEEQMQIEQEIGEGGQQAETVLFDEEANEFKVVSNPDFKKRPTINSGLDDIVKVLKARKIRKQTNALKFIHDINQSKKKMLKGKILNQSSTYQREEEELMSVDSFSTDRRSLNSAQGC